VERFSPQKGMGLRGHRQPALRERGKTPRRKKRGVGPAANLHDQSLRQDLKSGDSKKVGKTCMDERRRNSPRTHSRKTPRNSMAGGGRQQYMNRRKDVGQSTERRLRKESISGGWKDARETLHKKSKILRRVKKSSGTAGKKGTKTRLWGKKV